jgi:Fe2+ or Zn2+ uptake regulation protein
MPSMQRDPASLLRRVGLRHTRPRRLVLEALLRARTPLSYGGVHAQIAAAGGSVNLTTVYRILDRFAACGLVHRHLSSGGVVLCSLPEEWGHHVLLSCRACGRVEERCDPSLCRHEDRLAARAGFRSTFHWSEVVGTCAACS